MPAVLASASFDSCLGVFSGQDLSGAGTRSAPRWLRRPCGASFGFGGAIVSPFRPTKEDGTRNVAIRRMLVGDASAEKEFRQQLAQSAQGTDERVQLLEQRGLHLLAAASASGLSAEQAADVERQASAVLDSPSCGHFFAPDALAWAGNEVPVVVDGEPGRIDRLVALDEPGGRVWWVLDYKLHAAPGAVAAYRAQLAGYVKAVRLAQPGDRVVGAFVAAGGRVVELEA